MESTPYIGHPAYKAMGAGAGYVILTGHRRFAAARQVGHEAIQAAVAAFFAAIASSRDPVSLNRSRSASLSPAAR